MKDLYEHIDPHTNKTAPLIADDVFKIIWDNREVPRFDDHL